MSIPELTEQSANDPTDGEGACPRDFRPKAAEIDRARRPPIEENIKLLAEHGFTGLFVSHEGPV